MSKTIVENKSSKCTIFGYVMFQIVSFNGVTMATLEAVLNATKRIAQGFFQNSDLAKQKTDYTNIHCSTIDKFHHAISH